VAPGLQEYNRNTQTNNLKISHKQLVLVNGPDFHRGFSFAQKSILNRLTQAGYYISRLHSTKMPFYKKGHFYF
jgi:hypothetical protein